MPRDIILAAAAQKKNMLADAAGGTEGKKNQATGTKGILTNLPADRTSVARQTHTSKYELFAGFFFLFPAKIKKYTYIKNSSSTASVPKGVRGICAL